VNNNSTRHKNSSKGKATQRFEQTKYDSINFMKFIEDKEQLCKLAAVAKAPINHHIFVCNGKSCSAVGSADVKKAFAEGLEKRNLRYGKESKGRNPNGEILITDCGSVGFCAIGPAVLVYPANVWYAQVRPADVEEIIEKHLTNGEVVERLALVGCD
jgi:(2Fe-2S) ferredoxin